MTCNVTADFWLLNVLNAVWFLDCGLSFDAESGILRGVRAF